MQPLPQWYGVWLLLPRGPALFGATPTLDEAFVTARAIRRDAVRSPVWIADTRFGAWRIDQDHERRVTG